MISPSEFATRWVENCQIDCELYKFDPGLVGGLRIQETDKRFLVECGLPVSAAPFIGFGPYLDRQLITASEAWGLSDEFACYRHLGSNGLGDSICLDEHDGGSVVYLNHDNHFERVYMCRSVTVLAEILLLARRVFRHYTVVKGDDDWYERNDIPSDVLQSVESELVELDPAAAEPGTMFGRELLLYP